MSLNIKLFKLGFIGLIVMSVAVVAILSTAYLIYSPQLPPVDSLRDVKLQTPLKVYSREGKLIALFGEKRRIPLRYQELPQAMIDAFLAAEDDRFFEHPGVDYQGLLRAVINLVITGQKAQGGSTITMQLARNFFLTPERTYTRKFKEIMLALRIEDELSKQEILELYLNKIYLGQRAYGVGAAAEVYYGKSATELSLDQVAMIAGLPKAPSRFNPISNPERATVRRDYVLGRMLELNKISKEDYEIAIATPVEAKRYSVNLEVDAPYIGEMVRAHMVDLYGEEAYSAGYNVFTSVEANKQQAAVDSVQSGILAYDMRHGYRGPEGSIPVDQLTDIEVVAELVGNMPTVGDLQPGVVTELNEDSAIVALASEIIQLDLNGVTWARMYKSQNSLGPKIKTMADVLKAGDIIRVISTAKGWQLRQIPKAASALVSLRPEDGAITALTGGFDFYASKFNRATQAERQPGSSFKPFIYSAAIEAGFSPASIINDAPVVFEDQATEDSWRPQNYSGKFFGPTRMRLALTKSRNMVSIRLLRDIGRKFARDHAGKFGFDAQQLPKDLTLALGSGAVTPLTLANAYAILANGGYKVDAYFIERIEGPDGDVLFTADPARVCDEECTRLATEISVHAEELAELGLSESIGSENAGIQVASRVISEMNAYQMDSMLKDVIKFGTGRRALVLNRNDIAGKTGTTNDQHDAWFAGYHPNAATVVWLGFDENKPLGRGEVGGVAALPIWIDFMRVALQGEPYIERPLPKDMVLLKVHPETGAIIDQESGFGIEEAFHIDQVPELDFSAPQSISVEQNPDEVGQPQRPAEQLF
ncbi:MAG: penicillin-binding protein 1A [Gammaproteobacteria bacterium]|nr:penicillin-binding protein 1A [Gammaproteobacteria bacterium]